MTLGRANQTLIELFPVTNCVMPSPTSNLGSAEAVTRFLRSKEGHLPEILKIANDILDTKLDVYLPNKREFILSLLVDRLNDRSNSSNFSKWKLDKDVWNLLKRVLFIEGHNETSILQSLKIVDLMILLMESDDPEGWDCLPYVCQILSMFLKRLFMEIEESTGIRLLKSTLSYIQNKAPKNSSVTLDEIVTNVYWNSHPQGLLEVSKKSYSQFFEELFISLTKYLSIESELPSKHLYEEIFTTRVFYPENLPYLVHNLDKLLKKETPDDASLRYFFQMAVRKLAPKQMKLCTELFDVIVNKSPNLSESLLASLVGSHHALPQEFIFSVYTKEVASKKFIDLNWDMVKYVFELDSELAATKSKFVFEKYNSAFNLDEKVLPVGKVIVYAYAKNRELVEFLTKVWPKAIARDELWDGDDFIAHVANCIDSLSEKQIVQVLETSPNLLLEASFAVLTAITKGLISSSWKLIDSLKPTFNQIQSYINSSTNFWQVRYNLLNLYGSEFVIPESVLELDYDIYYHYTVLRLLELNIIQDYSNKKQRQLILFLRDNPSLISLAFCRWFVMINDYFTNESIVELLKLAFETAFLCHTDCEIYEQRNIMTCMMRLFIADPMSHFDHIPKIPLACFSRGPKKDLLNILTRKYIETKEVRVLGCIDYLLDSASYQSSIERDISVVLQILALAPTDEAQKYASSISKKVWKTNVDMIKSDENRAFVANAIGMLVRSMQIGGSGDVLPEMKMALIIVSHQSVLTGNDLTKYEELVNTFKMQCIRQIKDSHDNLDNAKLNWFLHGLASIPPSMLTFNDVKSIAGQIKIEANDTSIKQALFSLVCKCAKPDLRFAKYVLSLYLVLNTEAHTQHLFDDVVQYLQSLVNEKVELYYAICNYVIFSTADAEDTFSNSICMVLSALLTTMPKEPDGSLQIALFSGYLRNPLQLLPKVLQHIMGNLKWLLTQKQWLFNQYILEMALAHIGIVSSITLSDKHEFEQLYLESLRVVSQILLHHRFKLSTRHHSIIYLMCTFLESLVEPGQLGHSNIAAGSFTRLVSNLCEPQEHVRDLSVRSGQQNNRLTTQANLYKKQLRIYLPYLLINYIYLNLKFTFGKQVNDILATGVYTIFDSLSKSELQIVNSALDYAGKALYKSLYHDYQEYWKWKDQ